MQYLDTFNVFFVVLGLMTTHIFYISLIISFYHPIFSLKITIPAIQPNI